MRQDEQKITGIAVAPSEAVLLQLSRRVAEQYPCPPNVGVSGGGLGSGGDLSDGQASSAEQLADRFLIHEDLAAGIGHSR